MHNKLEETTLMGKRINIRRSEIRKEWLCCTALMLLEYLDCRWFKQNLSFVPFFLSLSLFSFLSFKTRNELLIFYNTEHVAQAPVRKMKTDKTLSKHLKVIWTHWSKLTLKLNILNLDGGKKALSWWNPIFVWSKQMASFPQPSHLDHIAMHYLKYALDLVVNKLSVNLE